MPSFGIDMIFKETDLFTGTGKLKQVPQSLCPCDGSTSCNSCQVLGVDLLFEFVQHGCDLAESSNTSVITHEIKCGCLWRRNADPAPWRVDVLKGDLLQVFSDDERNAHLAAGEGSSRFFKEHLEFLWTMMGRTMILRSGQESRVVGLVELSHQCRDELICRQAPQRTVFRWNDHIEAPCGLRDYFLFGEAVQGEFGCICGHDSADGGIRIDLGDAT